MGRGGEANAEEDDDLSDLDSSLLKLERRHDRLLLNGSDSKRTSSVLLGYSSSLQAEKDELELQVAALEQELAAKEAKWKEERQALERKREKAKRELRQELEQASLTMEQEIEKCGQIVRELNKGAEVKYEQDTRKLKLELQDSKQSYEARIKTLDLSLWNMKTQLTESEQKRAEDAKQFETLVEAKEEEFASRALAMERAHAAKLEERAGEFALKLEELRAAWQAELEAKRLEAERRQQPTGESGLAAVEPSVAVVEFQSSGSRIWLVWWWWWLVAVVVALAVAMGPGPNETAQQALGLLGNFHWRSLWCKLLGLQLLPPVS